MTRAKVLLLALGLALMFPLLAAPQEGPSYTFPRSRAEYRLNAAAGGTLVVDRTSEVVALVPFGEVMRGAAEMKSGLSRRRKRELAFGERGP